MIALVVGAGALAMLLFGRDQVVSTAPQTASLYAAIGLPVNVRGLTFRDVATSEVTDGGNPILVISGVIENVAGEPATVPRLRLAVRNQQGTEIYVWTAVPAKAQLATGESLPFRAQLASPPAEANDVSVRFLSRLDASSDPASTK